MTNQKHNERQGRAAGGPQTVAGKVASRRNATRHGLTSTTLLPEVLNGNRVEQHRQQLTAQYSPDNITERILVDEMARHAAMMELSEQAEGAVLRHGARELSKLILASSNESAEGNREREDAILSVAVSTDALDNFGRYRRTHEKAFFTALNKLGDLQSARRKLAQQQSADRPHSNDLLATEEACARQLRERFRQPDWRCPRCGHPRGSWLRLRKCWECGSCRRQVGARYATVMQGSRLPLRTWFAAIKLMLSDPEVSTKTVAEQLGLSRLATVRNLMAKVREALAAKNSRKLLVGLVDHPSGIVKGGALSYVHLHA